MGTPSERENTKEELIEELQCLYEKLGRKPKLSDLKEHSEFSQSKYYTAFLSWSNALYQAGIIDEKPTKGTGYSPHPTKHQIIQDIHRVTKRLGAPPTLPEMRLKGEFSSDDYERKFNDWDLALERAGYNPKNAGKGDQITKNKLAKEILDLADELHKVPRKNDFQQYSEFSPKLYEAHFGSIDDALQYAGYRGNGFTDRETLEQEIKSVALKLGRSPKPNDILDQTELSPFPYEHHFGSIKAAIYEVTKYDISDWMNESEEQLLHALDNITDEIVGDYLTDTDDLKFESLDDEFEAYGQMLAMRLLWMVYDTRQGIQPDTKEVQELREELRIVDELVVELDGGGRSSR